VEKNQTTLNTRFLHTSHDVTRAERATRKKLRSGHYVAKETWLTRWNSNTGQVETVLGEFKTTAYIEWDRHVLRDGPVKIDVCIISRDTPDQGACPPGESVN
jgi:hypothetical protein